MLPDALGNAAHPHLLIGSGKEGKIYLIDRDNMGKFSTTDNVVEEQAEVSGVLNEPAYFNNTIYYTPGYGGSAVTFSIANGSAFFGVTATHSTPDGFGNLVGSPTISANGTTNAIMWDTDTGSNSLRVQRIEPDGTLDEQPGHGEYDSRQHPQVHRTDRGRRPSICRDQHFVGDLRPADCSHVRTERSEQSGGHRAFVQVGQCHVAGQFEQRGLFQRPTIDQRRRSVR